MIRKFCFDICPMEVTIRIEEWKEDYMEYDFLVDTYDSERLKTLNVWSMFRDEDLPIRPHPLLGRDRNALEHMVHQCLSENKWFCNMFAIDVGAPPLPAKEVRLEFIKRYAEDSGKRLLILREKGKVRWEQEASFFDVKRTRTWIMARRIAHTAHHRAEMTTLLRLLGRQVHSVYGPSVDTGGLPDNKALTIYAYPDIDSLIKGESSGGAKKALPGPGDKTQHGKG
jgi:uncharacterized damage-inducible protein DinB